MMHISKKGDFLKNFTYFMFLVIFYASKLNAGCVGYLDKSYKIFVDIIDLKAGFPLANFFIRSDFFRSIIVRL